MKKIVLIIFTLAITFKANAQIFKQYTPGSYYDNHGQKINGLFHLNIWDDYILFKSDKDANKQKIKITDIQSVLLYDDSLSVQTYNNKKYLAKLAINGPVKMYYKFEVHASPPLPTTEHGYGVSKTLRADKAEYKYGELYMDTKKTPMYEDGNETFEITKKNFKDVMSKILVQYPETLKAIMDEKLKLKDIDAIVVPYFYGRLK